MLCMTELLGGVCHRTSTPHKSGNKMKEKKKKKLFLKAIILKIAFDPSKKIIINLKKKLYSFDNCLCIFKGDLNFIW